jgi:hypothetical protein
MNEEESQTAYIESRLREACNHFAKLRGPGADTGLAPIADGLILMADSLRLLVLKVDRLRAKRD